MGLDMMMFKPSESIDCSKDYSTRYLLDHYNEFEEIAYWRKVYSINQWIIDNIAHGFETTQLIRIDKEGLTKLLRFCVRVQNKKGFSESNSDDEFYPDKMEYTINTLRNIIADTSITVVYYLMAW